MKLFKRRKKNFVIQEINIFRDLSDLSEAEKRSYDHFQLLFKLNNPNVIRSQFNLDHWRKVKQARLNIN